MLPVRTKPIRRCRLCLSECCDVIPIFKDEFAKMIFQLTKLKVYANDPMPKVSCIQCALEVKQAMLTRKKILLSHKTLLDEAKSRIKTKTRAKTIPQEVTSDDIESLVAPSFSMSNQNSMVTSEGDPALSPWVDPAPRPWVPLNDAEAISTNNYNENHTNSEPNVPSNIIPVTQIFLPVQKSQDHNYSDMSDGGDPFEKSQYEHIVIKIESDGTDDESESAEVPESIEAPELENVIKQENYLESRYELRREFIRNRQHARQRRRKKLQEQSGESGVTIRFRRRKDAAVPEPVKIRAPCRLCGKLLHKNSLWRHERDHLEDGQEKNERLLKEAKLRRETRMHEGKVPCKICGKFLHRNSLWRHHKDHEEKIEDEFLEQKTFIETLETVL